MAECDQIHGGFLHPIHIQQLIHLGIYTAADPHCTEVDSFRVKRAEETLKYAIGLQALQLVVLDLIGTAVPAAQGVVSSASYLANSICAFGKHLLLLTRPLVFPMTKTSLLRIRSVRSAGNNGIVFCE